MRMLNRLISLLLTILLVFSLTVALADDTPAATFGSVTFPLDATYIDLGTQRVSDYHAFVLFLKKFPNLEKVDMFATPIWRPRVEELSTIFPNIEFGWTIQLAEHTIRTDQTAFSTLHNNKSDPHDERLFSVLKYCRNLEALDIGHNAVKDLSFLYDLPHLKVLIVACNIDLKDITPIGSLKELQYLELFKNDINDISCLANCTELVDLNICFNRIRDWTPLYGLKKLERLWLFNSSNYSDIPIPKDVVSALKENLPNTNVDPISYSTLGGWREHPRYFELYDFFRTGIFIPFASLENKD